MLGRQFPVRPMFAPFRRYIRRNRYGLGGSLALHLALILAALGVFSPRDGVLPTPPPAIVPIDLIQIGMDTQSPSRNRPSMLPQQSAPPLPKQDSASPSDQAVSKRGTKPAQDAIEAKLRDLARLKQTVTNPREVDFGASNLTAGTGDGDRAIYGVKDYIRAQVLRRWSLNLNRLGGRDFTVRIRMAIKRDGTLLFAEIAENRTDDVLYTDTAIGARNAVILSSPFQLPPADYPKTMEFTLDLNPRDARR